MSGTTLTGTVDGVNRVTDATDGAIAAAGQAGPVPWSRQVVTRWGFTLTTSRRRTHERNSQDRIASDRRAGCRGGYDAVQNLGPDTVYYGNRSVSSTSNLGSISAAGTETGLASGLHFMASGRAMLLVSSDAAVFSVTPEQFGAVGDGVALSDVSISSGSNVFDRPARLFPVMSERSSRLPAPARCG